MAIEVEMDKEIKGKLRQLLEHNKYGSWVVKGIAAAVAAIVSISKLLFWILVVSVLYWLMGPGSVVAFLLTIYIINDFLNEYDRVRDDIFKQLDEGKA